jgi:hypothetical protein
MFKHMLQMRNAFTQSAFYLFKIPFVIAYAGWMTLALSKPEEADLVKIIENTSYILVTSPTEDSSRVVTKDNSRRYCIIHEQDLDLWTRESYGSKPTQTMHEIYIVYSRKAVGGDYSDARIHHFMLNGRSVECTDMQMSALMLLSHILTHPLSHLFSNDLIFPIIDMANKKGDMATDLRPSTHTTLELHRGLLASKLSPVFIRPFGVLSPGGFPPTPNTFLRLVHDYDASGRSHRIAHHPQNIPSIKSPYVHFFLRSQKLFSKCMRKHAIPGEYQEPVWLHTVVHASDHYQFFKFSQFRHSSLIETLDEASTWHIFIYNIFRVMFIRPHLNPLADNKIKNIHKPFYQDLYHCLLKIDLELADQVTASVMYSSSATTSYQ